MIVKFNKQGVLTTRMGQWHNNPINKIYVESVIESNGWTLYKRTDNTRWSKFTLMEIYRGKSVFKQIESYITSMPIHKENIPVDTTQKWPPCSLINTPQSLCKQQQ
jgi:hypothetical protein